MNRNKGIGFAALGLLLAGCAAAPAAPVAVADAEVEMERRAVTGSRIKVDVPKDAYLLKTMSPVRVYTRDDLDRTGHADIGDALRSVTIIGR